MKLVISFVVGTCGRDGDVCNRTCMQFNEKTIQYHSWPFMYISLFLLLPLLEYNFKRHRDSFKPPYVRMRSKPIAREL
jgi:hypothetical protein